MGIYRWLKFQAAKANRNTDVRIVPYTAQELFDLLFSEHSVKPEVIDIGPLVKTDGWRGLFAGMDRGAAAELLSSLGQNPDFAPLAVQFRKPTLAERLFNGGVQAQHPFADQKLREALKHLLHHEKTETPAENPEPVREQPSKGRVSLVNGKPRTRGEVFAQEHGFDNLPPLSGPTAFDRDCKYHPQSREELIRLARDPKIFLGDIDTSAITDMSGVFENCSRRSYEGLESWNVRNVRNFDRMFKGAFYFTGKVQYSERKTHSERNLTGKYVTRFEFDPDAQPFDRPDTSIFGFWNTNSALSAEAMCSECPNFAADLSHFNPDHIKNFDTAYIERMTARSPEYLKMVKARHELLFHKLDENKELKQLDPERYGEFVEDYLVRCSSVSEEEHADTGELSFRHGNEKPLFMQTPNALSRRRPVWPVKADGQIKGAPFVDHVMHEFLELGERKYSNGVLERIMAKTYDQNGNSVPCPAGAERDPESGRLDLSSFDLSAQQDLKDCCQGNKFSLKHAESVDLGSLVSADGFLKNAVSLGCVDLSRSVKLESADSLGKNAAVYVKGTDVLYAPGLKNANHLLENNRAPGALYSLQILTNSENLENVTDAFAGLTGQQAFRPEDCTALDCSAIDQIRLHGFASVGGFCSGSAPNEVVKDFVKKNEDTIFNYNSTSYDSSFMHPDSLKLSSDDTVYFKQMERLEASSYDRDAEMHSLAESFLQAGDPKAKAAVVFVCHSAGCDDFAAARCPERFSQPDGLNRPGLRNFTRENGVIRNGGLIIVPMTAEDLKETNRNFWDRGFEYCKRLDPDFKVPPMPEDFTVLSKEKCEKYGVDLDNCEVKLYNNLHKIDNILNGRSRIRIRPEVLKKEQSLRDQKGRGGF